MSAEVPDRVSMFAFYRIFINVGSIVAPAIIEFIGTDHFRALFLISAGGYVLTAILLVFFKPQIHTQSATAKTGDTNYKEAKTSSESHVANPASHNLVLWSIFIAMGI